MVKRLWCMSLHSAGLVIGWLSSISSIVAIFIIFFLRNSNEESEVYRVEICSLLVATSLFLLFSILLIIGIEKNRHLLLLPWLIASGISLFCYLTSSLFAFFWLATMKLLNEALLSLVFSGLQLAISTYIFLAISSLYKEIKASRKVALEA